MVGELALLGGQESAGKRVKTFKKKTNKGNVTEHGLAVLGKGVWNSLRQMFFKRSSVKS